MSMGGRLLVAAAVLGVGTSMWGTPAGGDTGWRQVGSTAGSGISGVAATPTGWVIVRDVKSASGNRVSLLSADDVVTPLSWPGTAPKDLEAIDAVPGQPGRFAVVTSAGAGTIISISGTRLSIVRSFRLPKGRTQNEAFTLTRVGTTTVALWGNRGSTTAPGRLYAAAFNPTTGAFGAAVSRTVSVPYPSVQVRHISDAEVVGDRIFIASASDPGSNGPFASAVYEVGTVGLTAGRARLSMTTPVQLDTFVGHKVEGLACSEGTGLLGTDDENQGAWVGPATFCQG